MTSKDMRLIHSFIDKKNPKVEHLFSHFNSKDNTVSAYDQKYAIRCHLEADEWVNREKDCMTHYTILEAITKAGDKLFSFSFNKNSAEFLSKDLIIQIDNNVKNEVINFDFENVFKDRDNISKYRIDTIANIDFFLTERGGYFLYKRLESIVKFLDDVSFIDITLSPQQGIENLSLVKLDAYRKDEYDNDYLRFEMVLLGIPYDLQKTLFE